MDDRTTYYEILGLDPGATLQEVKQAYRDLVRVWHPDRFQHDPRLQKKAQEKLKQINLAYKVLLSTLKDPASKGSSYKRHTAQDEHEHYADSGQREYHQPQTEPTTPPYKPIRNVKSIAAFFAFALIAVLFFTLINESQKPRKEIRPSPLTAYSEEAKNPDQIRDEYLADQNEDDTDQDYAAPSQEPRFNVPIKELDVVPSEPKNPVSLPIGSSPYGPGIKSGNSILFVDNGTETDALVKVIRINNGEQHIRNLYIPKGKKWSANKIPPGEYILRVAYGTDWDSKARKFNFHRSFSETETFDIYEKTSVEQNDEGVFKRTKYSKMTITLHKVLYGNFKSHEINEEDFDR